MVQRRKPPKKWSWSFLPLRLSTLSSFPSPPLWPVVVGCGGGVYVYTMDMYFILCV